jgi:hypothetical protein
VALEEIGSAAASNASPTSPRTSEIASPAKRTGAHTTEHSELVTLNVLLAISCKLGAVE